MIEGGRQGPLSVTLLRVQTLSEIKALLAGRGIRPKHRFGQNFLHDHNMLRKLVDAARVRPGELVLEVGPGTGTLIVGHGEVAIIDPGPDLYEHYAALQRAQEEREVLARALIVFTEHRSHWLLQLLNARLPCSFSRRSG